MEIGDRHIAAAAILAVEVLMVEYKKMFLFLGKGDAAGLYNTVVFSFFLAWQTAKISVSEVS